MFISNKMVDYSVAFFNYLSHKELKFLTQLVTPRVRDSSNTSIALQKERVEYAH
jgi:hypothetical protein